MMGALWVTGGWGSSGKWCPNWHDVRKAVDSGQEVLFPSDWTAAGGGRKSSDDHFLLSEDTLGVCVGQGLG